jgi:hypothetical protein
MITPPRMVFVHTTNPVECTFAHDSGNNLLAGESICVTMTTRRTGKTAQAFGKATRASPHAMTA